ncbi:MAG: cupin domain-containing protein [Nocardioidaceae bacterium]
MRHHLLNDARLELEHLARLAERHPGELIEQNDGGIAEVASAGDARVSALPPAEIVRTIDSNGLWMVLKNIERDPEYKRLLDVLLDEVAPIVASNEGGMMQREGFIFLSAPHATTPSHTDPEHNFLLQIRGVKEMVVGEFPDRRTRQLEIENQSSGGHRNVDWTPVRPQTFRLEPGDGVYVPPHAPHLVRNGSQPSISLSITFRTPLTERTARASSVNARLRRLHLDPKAPGERPRVDRAKAGASRALGRFRRR